jgi:ABC-type transport system substrate-binding protein
MKKLFCRSQLEVAAALLFVLVGATCSPSQTASNAGTTPSEDEGEQAVIIATETPGALSHFTVTGNNTDFGRYLALGEATLAPGQEAGVLREGTGIAVLKAQNGEQIVADVTCKVSTDGVDFTFHWRDSVTFSNGSTVSNTGAFVNQRPPGLALIRTRLSAVYIDGLCCAHCCDENGHCYFPCDLCPNRPTCK